jgi:predicted MFS family arabinose efflux permease
VSLSSAQDAAALPLTQPARIARSGAALAGPPLLPFLALSFTAGTSIGTGKVATSLYALRLGARPLEIGLIAGGQSVALLLMSVPVALLLERLGPRRVFTIGSLLAGLGYLAVPLVPTPLYLFACTFLGSLALPLRFITLQTVFFGYLERAGAARAGWHRAASMVGVFLVGPAAAGAAVTRLGFAATYVVIGVSFWVAILLARPVLPASGEPRLGTPLAARGAARVWERLVSIARLLTDRDLVAASLLDFWAQATLMYFTFFIVPIAVQRFGFAPATAALLIALQGALFIAALFAFGVLLVRLGPRRF